MTRIIGLSICIVKALVECRKYWPTSFLSSNFIGIIAANKCAVQDSECFYSPEIASVIISTLPHYYGNSRSSFPSVLLSCYRIISHFSFIEHIYNQSYILLRKTFFFLMRMTWISLSTCSEVTSYKLDWARISNIPLNIETLSLQFKQSSLGICMQTCVFVPQNLSKGHLCPHTDPSPLPSSLQVPNDQSWSRTWMSYQEQDGDTESRGSLLPFCLMWKILDTIWPNIWGVFGNIGLNV